MGGRTIGPQGRYSRVNAVTNSFSMECYYNISRFIENRIRIQSYVHVYCLVDKR